MQLGLNIDEFQILRYYGHYTNAAITEEMKYPKLLRHKAYFTSIVIVEIHEHLVHAIHWNRFIKSIGYRMDKLKLNMYCHDV